MPKQICVVNVFTNEDGRFVELRDSKGLKCVYRADEDEADVSITCDITTGEVTYAYIGDPVADECDD